MIAWEEERVYSPCTPRHENTVEVFAQRSVICISHVSGGIRSEAIPQSAEIAITAVALCGRQASKSLLNFTAGRLHSAGVPTAIACGSFWPSRRNEGPGPTIDRTMTSEVIAASVAHRDDRPHVSDLVHRSFYSKEASKHAIPHPDFMLILVPVSGLGSSFAFAKEPAGAVNAIDHILPWGRGIDQVSAIMAVKLGFQVRPGRNPAGVANRYVRMADRSYIELLAITRPDADMDPGMRADQAALRGGPGARGGADWPAHIWGAATDPGPVGGRQAHLEQI